MLDGKSRRELARYTDNLMAEVSAMTVKELRQFAHENGLVGSLGGATTKRGLRDEIVGQMRHRKSLEMEERNG